MRPAGTEARERMRAAELQRNGWERLPEPDGLSAYDHRREGEPVVRMLNRSHFWDLITTSWVRFGAPKTGAAGLEPGRERT